MTQVNLAKKSSGEALGLALKATHIFCPICLFAHFQAREHRVKNTLEEASDEKMMMA